MIWTILIATGMLSLLSCAPKSSEDGCSSSERYGSSGVLCGEDRALLTATLDGQDAVSEYDFGSVRKDESKTVTLKITNSGRATATNLKSATVPYPFAYVGRSFPGTTGTCRDSLEKKMSCTIVVAMSPSTTTVYTGASLGGTTDLIQYDDGAGNSKTLSYNLTGVGNYCASSSTYLDYTTPTSTALFTGTWAGTPGSGIWIAQSFRIAAAKTISKVSAKMYLASGSDTLSKVVASIYDDCNETPCTTALASGSVSNLTTTAATYTITLDAPISLAADRGYWLTLNAQLLLGGIKFVSNGSGATSYDGGSVKFSSDSAANWTSYPTDDILFALDACGTPF